MDIIDIVTPYQPEFDFHIGQLGAQISAFSNNVYLEDFDLAIIGVEESRGNEKNRSCYKAPNAIRKELYQLFSPIETPISIIDLGNIKEGYQPSDSYYALQNIIIELIKKNVIPIILGGSQDLTYANFLAYQHLEQVVNIVSIDRKFDIGYQESETINSENYLTHILLHQPNYLFNYSNIGYQSYFVSTEELELINKLHFDAHRLGRVQKQIEEVEPIVRNADIISFDISAIRHSEAPACALSTPNGFFGNEACQIARYAGLSDKVSSFGIYEANPELDHLNTTMQLAAQIVWYFIEGFYHRKQDFPIGDKSSYLKYIINYEDGKEIIFYKSDKTDRWWMEVPYPENKQIKFARHLMVPCSYKDYQTACNNEVPDNWWKTYLKLS